MFINYHHGINSGAEYFCPGTTMFIFNLKISAKVLLGVGALLCALLIVGVVGIGALNESNRRLVDMYEQELVLLEAIDDAKSSLYRIRGDSLEYVLAERPESHARLREEISQQYDRLLARLAEIGATRLSQTEAELLAILERDALAYIGLIDREVYAPIAAGDYAAAEASARDAGADIFREAREAANGLMDYSVERASQRMENSAAEHQAAMTQVGIAVSAAVLAGLLIVWFLHRSVSQPISRMTDTMTLIAQGDLEQQVPSADRKDEIGAMARAVEVFRQNGIRVRDLTEEEKAAMARRAAERAAMMHELQLAFGDVVDAATAGDFSKEVSAQFPDAEVNELARSVNSLVQTVNKGLTETGHVLGAMAQADLTLRVTGDYKGAFLQLKQDTNAVAEKLTEIVGQLRDTSGSLKVATGEILSGADDLSERTTKQAATVEETSAAAQQLAVTVSQNATRAQEASSTAGQVAKAAEDGGAVMQHATQAMERIASSSAKISNIIGMIDDIAFQTNLLALNASVEAARAGEAGKGFAVVAIEVRRLAQSAAQASTDVKALIEQSGTEVRSGTKLVAEAAKGLEGIVSSVRTMTGLMSQIATDSQEQSNSIDEVSLAVRQMDEMTQHNAALVEQTNAAIEKTEAQAVELDRIVDIFRIAAAGQQRLGSSSAATRGDRGNPVQALQRKVRTAATSFSSHGNAAAKIDDWTQF
jgi:methyl-accepting chemotaxis protein